jgi:hypothetical protein
MGWISQRARVRGTSLYDEGPKRKGPLRKIVERVFVGTTDFFGNDVGWLECGHFCERMYGNQRAICTKCKLGAPKDARGKDGWPKSTKRRVKK